MKTKKSSSELSRLMNYEHSLASVTHLKSTQEQLSRFGYTPERIAEGKALLDETRKAMDEKHFEHLNCKEAHIAFSTIYDKLCTSYDQHRDISKVIFRKDDTSREKLAINGIRFSTYRKTMEGITIFYDVATNDPEIRSELEKLKLTTEKLESAKDLIGQVKAAWEHYIGAKLKAQYSTKIKNEAFARLKDWMKDFNAVSKIAKKDYKLFQDNLGKTG